MMQAETPRDAGDIPTNADDYEPGDWVRVTAWSEGDAESGVPGTYREIEGIITDVIPPEWHVSPVESVEDGISSATVLVDESRTTTWYNDESREQARGRFEEFGTVAFDPDGRSGGYGVRYVEDEDIVAPLGHVVRIETDARGLYGEVEEVDIEVPDR